MRSKKIIELFEAILNRLSNIDEEQATCRRKLIGLEHWAYAEDSAEEEEIDTEKIRLSTVARIKEHSNRRLQGKLELTESELRKSRAYATELSLELDSLKEERHYKHGAALTKARQFDAENLLKIRRLETELAVLRQCWATRKEEELCEDCECGGHTCSTPHPLQGEVEELTSALHGSEAKARRYLESTEEMAGRLNDTQRQLRIMRKEKDDHVEELRHLAQDHKRLSDLVITLTESVKNDTE